MKNRVRHGGALLAVLGALALTGCASPVEIENFAGVPLVPASAPADGESADEEPADGQDAEGEEVEAEAEAELVELEVSEGEPAAVYLDYGDRLAIVMWGSSTCPPVGESIEVLEDQHSGNSVRIHMAELPADAVCTADLLPHTTVFGTPENTTTTQPLLIDIDGQEIVLPIK
ncbi:hypothetical protein [Cellulomonas xylanilytica]|uniref:Lipoprotein n=1 Tax=Cellulomonas xylanilytica TaxID=233583 RepID=A0A510V6V7_9CELL|nr:hypothetical protein [Cellulomonas xylanilytica]GEK22608.1 hypothetical protein CXY01_31280 [Cellulomonas xylanilytica]